MTQPASYFPTSALPVIQECATINDILGTFTQKSDVVLTGGYAVSGGDGLIAGTGAFTNWPDYGVFQNLNTNEIILYTTKTSTTLTFKNTGRALSGSSAAIGTIADTIRFIEARMLGKIVNQISVEIAALEVELGVSPTSGQSLKGSLSNLLARLNVSLNFDGTIKNTQTKLTTDTTLTRTANRSTIINSTASGLINVTINNSLFIAGDKIRFISVQSFGMNVITSSGNFLRGDLSGSNILFDAIGNCNVEFDGTNWNVMSLTGRCESLS